MSSLITVHELAENGEPENSTYNVGKNRKSRNSAQRNRSHMLQRKMEAPIRTGMMWSEPVFCVFNRSINKLSARRRILLIDTFRAERTMSYDSFRPTGEALCKLPDALSLTGHDLLPIIMLLCFCPGRTKWEKCKISSHDCIRFCLLIERLRKEAWPIPEIRKTV